MVFLVYIASPVPYIRTQNLRKSLLIRRNCGKTPAVPASRHRIDETFARLRGKGQKAFIAYIGAGDPDLEATKALTLALEGCGTDIIELGIPFSDPLADGIVNQMAAQRGLDAGTTVRSVLGCVRSIRLESEIPIVLYTYMNPLCSFGFERFHCEAEEAGVDGMLILDLPPDEEIGEPPVTLKHIRLIAPTTPPARIATITAQGGGFIYYVSREGVTGEQTTVAATLEEQVGLIREATDLPIAVGFGISTPDQARQVARCADAVVVGSAIVKRIAEHGRDGRLLEAVCEFVRPLVEAVKQD